MGRKAATRSTLGRATTAARGVGRSVRQEQDIGRAQETLQSHAARLQELEAELQSEMEEVRAQFDPLTEELETVVVRPKKKDISADLVALAWTPHWVGAEGERTPAWE